MKFTKNKILSLLRELGSRLLAEGLEGEIGVVGGAAMVLAYDARAATKDIDAIFKPSQAVRKLIHEIASENNLPEDWLNDGVKGFLPGNPRNKIIVFNGPGLHVWVPEPEYMLAMKAMSARVDTHDADDLKFLIKKLRLKNDISVFSIVEKYYPNHEIPVKLKFFIQELFERDRS